MWRSKLFFACFLVLGVGAAGAEEFHLRDGSKLRGKILGVEGQVFEVETNAGVVLIHRNRIRQIVFDSPEGQQRLSPDQVRVRFAAMAPRQPSTGLTPEVSPSPGLISPPPMARELARPMPPPKPAKMIEQVSATSYSNESFGFRMYKPPTWRTFPALVKPDNPLLAALGTPDETTLLLVGQEIFPGDLTTYVRLAEDSLKQLYPDYRKLSEGFTRFAGFPALERHFTGSAEGRFWTGMAIYFAHGDSHYTFLGVTANADLLSFQQSLLRKIVNTVEFGRRRSGGLQP